MNKTQISYKKQQIEILLNALCMEFERLANQKEWLGAYRQHYNDAVKSGDGDSAKYYTDRIGQMQGSIDVTVRSIGCYRSNLDKQISDLADG